MKLHANAQTCPHCRLLIVSRVMDGQMPVSVAQDFRVSIKTVFKWVARFRAEVPLVSMTEALGHTESLAYICSRAKN